jgi:hypothetical protein
MLSPEVLFIRLHRRVLFGHAELEASISGVVVRRW